jgi:hypothetical protein
MHLQDHGPAATLISMERSVGVRRFAMLTESFI